MKRFPAAYRKLTHHKPRSTVNTGLNRRCQWIWRHFDIYNGILWSQRSEVGIATGYGLDERGVGVRVPGGSRISSDHIVQTGSGVHPSSYPMGKVGWQWHGSMQCDSGLPWQWHGPMQCDSGLPWEWHGPMQCYSGLPWQWHGPMQYDLWHSPINASFLVWVVSQQTITISLLRTRAVYSEALKTSLKVTLFCCKGLLNQCHVLLSRVQNMHAVSGSILAYKLFVGWSLASQEGSVITIKSEASRFFTTFCGMRDFVQDRIMCVCEEKLASWQAH
jgi:hypothetical protein